MQPLHYMAWLCTGPAPSDASLLSMHLGSLGGALVATVILIYAIYATKKHVTKKGGRVVIYITAIALFVSALAFIYTVHEISTCGHTYY